MFGEETRERFSKILEEIRAAGLYKSERIITSRQDAHIETCDNNESLNLCANNYLGLASHPEIIAAARKALDEWGYGLSSVRFICGTQMPHKHLETSAVAAA
jgi:glycine C-acetyltransferase